jgi:3-phosphoshikimate 1-carboxyvinyltransferase
MTKYNAEPVSVRVPGSKSITNRALLLATMADGISRLEGVLFSDDSRHFLKCVQDLGFETKVDEEKKIIEVTGHGGDIPFKEASQYVGSAGTAARFLTAYLGVSHGTYHMDASEQMRRRPMLPLINSLRELGCDIECTEKEGFFPFTIKSNGFGKSEITVDINNSSQFLSALLIASCLADNDFVVRIQGTHGMSYIDMTCKMMEQFGVKTVYNAGENSFTTSSGQHYRAMEYKVEPDVSAACYFYACAPLLNVPVMVEGVHSRSLQGDIAFVDVLKQMGCSLEEREEGIAVYPSASGSFNGVNVDMSAFSDQAITLAAIAPFADSPTTITGIGHIRFQESDRINAIVTELGRMGIRCESTDESITIYPGTPKAVCVSTYEDHRMAMGFALTKLKCAGMVIDNPQCCRKTFENYFEVMDDFLRRIKNRG